MTLRAQSSLIALLLLLIGCKDEPRSATTAVAEAPQTAPAPSSPRRPAYIVVPGKKPVPGIQRVLIITLDGMRPDLLLRANTPNVRSLMAQGTFTMWARNNNEAETLPSHTCIVTGVTTDKHGISWNYHIDDSYPQTPTIFELAKKAGLKSALVTGKTKFVALRKPGTVDWSWIPQSEPNADATVATEAAQIIRDHKPHVMLVHLPNVDDLGHFHGWGTPWHLSIIEKADAAVGILLATLREENLLDSTCILITADHGGQGYSHWGGDERSRYVPWIASGPGIRKNFDLTLFEARGVNVMDTFATACALLAIPYPDQTDGYPVLEMLEGKSSIPVSPYGYSETNDNPADSPGGGGLFKDAPQDPRR